jgi:hypothetical protein
MTQQPHDLVNHFNHDHTIGTPVRYWTGTREGDGKTSHIRTRAELMGGHTPVVWVEGEASAIALTHIEPITLDPLARARALAADYQANPTPARAHNAAQVLGEVLRVLDSIGAGTLATAAARTPSPICFADGPMLGANTLTCYLPRGHEGDHSTNAHPNPRTWPQLATGGIVDTTTARIGDS